MSWAFLTLWFALQVTPDKQQSTLRLHVEAGLAAKHAGDLETAIREFRLVAELAPTLPASHLNLAAVFCEKGDYGAAIPSLKKALDLDPNLTGAHEMLGVALIATGYAAEAVPHLEAAHADGLLGLGLLDSGRPREAVDKLEVALENHPGDPDLLYYLGQAHARLSRQAFHVLATDYPDSARSRQLLGDAAMATGNRSAAEKHFRAALDLRPTLRDVHYSLGELYLASGDYERAEREFRLEAGLNPRSAAVAYKLGSVLLNRGDVSHALLELQKANLLQPGMPETLLELAKADTASGNLKAAEEFLQEMLKQEQDSSLAEAAHFQLAQIYRKLGRVTDEKSEMSLFYEIRRKRQ